MKTVLIVALLSAWFATSERKGEFSAAETRRMVDAYGKCIVRKQPALASRAIIENVDNSRLMNRFSRLIDGTCLPLPKGVDLEARFQGDQYRYALADALVRRELAAISAPDLTAIPQLDHRDPGDPPLRVDDKGRPLKEKKYREAMEDYERSRAFTYLSRYGECVVRADPAAARALLLTVAESPEENAHFNSMAATFGSCLAEGETLKFGKLVLRGTIAINYYRLAKVAASSSSEAPQ